MTEPRHISASDPGFPPALAAISPALWYRGRLPDAYEQGLAIVGSRAASVEGCRRAHALAAAAAGHGFAIVSGGALGIDAAAHRGALSAEGSTFAVLGCGVDVAYPDRHGPLYEEIVLTGGLLSEYPPGTQPRSGQFPVRNRLVAALAQVVMVVEAQFKSGALITANLALGMGRRLFALPGSPGTDALIAAGKARPVVDEGDLARALAGEPAPAREIPMELGPLLAALAGGGAPLGAPAIAARLGRSLPDTLALIGEAELDGWIRRCTGGTFAVTRESQQVNRGS
jgi:DNA processing protein